MKKVSVGHYIDIVDNQKNIKNQICAQLAILEILQKKQRNNEY